MATSPRASQTRLPLASPLLQHDGRPASTLVARQFTASLTASQVFPPGKDAALVDATAGAVNITLPPGSEEIVGLPFYARKTDVSANAVGLVRAGSDTFAPGAGTSITATVQGAEIGAMWDGTNWRAVTGAASGGAVAATTITASGTITANGTLDVNGNLDLAGATVVAPFVVPRWYTSQEIDFADLGSGATDTIALTGLPAGSWHVLAVHVETGAATTSSSGDTTGLAIQVGHTGGNVDALVESTSIFGAASKKIAPPGVEVGGYVNLADALEVLFTATGGSADLDDIDAMRLHVALLLAPAPAITFA